MNSLRLTGDMAIQFNPKSNITHDRTITSDKTRDSFADSILPLNLWSHILSFLCQDPRQRHTVAACAQVNHVFLQFCLEQASSLGMLYAFNRLSAPGAPQSIIRTSLQLPNFYQKCLAVGKDGTHYYSSIDKEHILYIIKSTTKGCELISLDLENVIGIQTQSQFLRSEQNIVSCHLTPSGFIVVTWKGCSVWKYDKAGHPVFHSFYVLPVHYTHRIWSSSYHNGVLLVTIRNRMFPHVVDTIILKMIELNDKAPQFSEVYLSQQIELLMGIAPNANYELFDIGKHFIMREQGRQKTICSISISEIDGKKVVIPENAGFNLVIPGYKLINEEVFDNFSNVIHFYRSKWPYFVLVIDDFWSTFPCFYLHNIEKENLKKENLLIELEPLLDGNGRSPHVFVTEDYFLFVSFLGGNVQIIHLPTKEDYMKKLKPFLEPYLNQNTILFSANTRFERRLGMFLDVLILDKRANRLSQVAIPLTGS
jgi:hypothetical protein